MPKSKTPETKRRIWGLKRSDDEISAFVRQRDGRCMYPSCVETERLQCSHYFGRAINNTRFHPDNLIALCWLHHYGSKLIGWEYAKQREELHGRDGEYTLFMKKWLGGRFVALEARAKKSVKQSSAIIELMELLSTSS